MASRRYAFHFLVETIHLMTPPRWGRPLGVFVCIVDYCEGASLVLLESCDLCVDREHGLKSVQLFAAICKLRQESFTLRNATLQRALLGRLCAVVDDMNFDRLS